ncbi:T9SS type A sorting domain-containing protein [Polluticoccus soli]|uniref:T9SS type A sorting domain-containing protein n=1 Tax=Polluticoccus soli TaxID=3034150 RepID=UPI0023E11DA6|nr:T9SS type A sorting domain-containing protein [Flavipsychrobacter sp. JY13-12]
MYSKLCSAIFLSFIALLNTPVSLAQCNPTSLLSATTVPPGTGAQLSWSAIAGATSYQVFIAPKPATLPPPSSAGTLAYTNGFYAGSLTPHTTYDVCIRTVCSSGVSTWYCDTFRTEPTLPCYDPTSVSAYTSGPHGIAASWSLGSFSDSSEYKVVLWPDKPGSSATGTPTNKTAVAVYGVPSLATHNFCVRSICDFATTPYSNWVCDTTSTSRVLAVSEIDNDAINIYPNPTTNKIYIEAGQDAINEISLADPYGKVLLHSSLHAKERKEIDLAPYARGVYLLTYETPNGTISRKIQKL